ncbi:MAG: transport-associated protein [Nitrospinae bacterium CG11_big_fil_rev_8_21_14_0_20_56_8]|nr:MAG: transport-associated protein [Nitrospinae bacterium CG11_big_fil_rev_8_21_14_0_20_56_8]
MNIVKGIGIVACVILLASFTTGCKEKGPAEKAGEQIDKAAEKAGKKVDELLGK